MSVTVTEDELDKKPDTFEVTNKKPGFVYRFLNVNSRNIGAKLHQGYEIVKDKDPEKVLMTDSSMIKKGADLDTTQRINDVVLARIPVEKHNKIKAHVKALTDRQSKMIVQDFDRDAGPLGFNPKRDPTGHATRYHAGTTQTLFDKENLPDPEFEKKYGMPKGQVES